MTTVARPLAAPNTTLPGLALSILTASLGISIVMVALPRLSEAFATSIAASQWVVLSFILASTVASVIIGRLADVAGRRRLLAGCLLLFAGASVLAFAAPNLAVLLAARGIQGVAAAGMMALPMALIRDLLPPERSGTAMGVLGSTSAIGTALGPSVGGLLLGQYGWRSVFLVLVPMALGTLLLLMRSLPRDVPTARRSGGLLGDPAGTLLLAVTLVAYSLSMTLGGGLFWPLLAATVLGAAVLAGIERRAAAPLIPPALLRGGGLPGKLAMNVLVSAVMMSTLVVGPFFLAFGLGLSDRAVGLVMSVGPAVAALSGFPAGRLTDRIGAERASLLGLVQIVIGTSCLALLPTLIGTVGYLVSLSLLTPGFQLFFAANNTATLARTEPDQRGTVSGLLNLSRNLGFITGTSAMAALFAWASGGTVATASPGALATGMSVTFLLSAALALGAVAASVRAAWRR